jgi:dTDP-glucose pyrophosphorylase
VTNIQTSDRISETTVLIPAAGRVAEGILALSSISCPAMVPVGGRPVIYWTIKYLRSLGLRKFVIAVASRGLAIEDFLECTIDRDCEVRFMVPDGRGGVGDTVRNLADYADSGPALVVLGDTHFQFSNASEVWTTEPAVLIAPVTESERWCTAEVTPSGYVHKLHDKSPELPEPLQALIGVYYFPDVRQLRTASRDAAEVARSSGRRTEFSDILNRIATDSPIRALPAGDWLDCGNPDRQASSHRAMLQKRDFNELQIDPVFGTITKRSQNREKFIDEINYLRLLPPDLAVLFPRVVASSSEWSDPFVTMEYYGYPTLSEAFVFESVSANLWDQIFVHLREIIERGFMTRQRPISAQEIRRMYLDKTRERVSQLESSDLFARLLSAGEVMVNGQKLANLRKLWPQIEQRVASLAANVTGCVIHGDLCLSNVLYDLRSRIVKLIDPRGSFGQAGIYGDPRYDVAKLFHSTHGLYDFLVNDLFDLEVNDNVITFDVRAQKSHCEIGNRFERVFFPAYDRDEILLITALLFASMPALHYDVPRRQMAMYVRSLQLFDELFRNPSDLQTSPAPVNLPLATAKT